MERRIGVGLVLLVLACLAASAGASAAVAKPTVALSLPPTADEGAPISFSWSGKHLGQGHKLVIQKPMGTANAWRSIMRLSSNKGSAQLPAMALGKYRFRIVDLIGKRVLAQDRGHVAVFGQVPFSTLFGRSGYEHVVATPAFTFTFVGPAHDVFGTDTNIFTLVHPNHCRSAHIEFVTQGEHPAITSAKVIQESREPVSASVSLNTIGSIDAELVPGQSWGMMAVAAYKEGGPDLYLNGYAVCDSMKPFWG